MSSKLFTKLYSKFYDIAKDPLVIRGQSRSFGTKKKKKEDKEKCPNKTCEASKRKKKSIWNIFSSASGEKEEKQDQEDCIEPKERHGCPSDSDLSEFGGTPYRTCGRAYVIQKDLVERQPDIVEPEEKLLEKIERDLTLKEVEDPMPPFESVEQRMIKLCELGLHPAYKRYMSLPKPQTDLKLPKHLYKSRSGPIADDEYPAHLKLSKECLDRKNIFSEFKRAEPPRQLLVKMLEIKQNEKPTLERKAKEEKDKANEGQKVKVEC